MHEIKICRFYSYFLSEAMSSPLQRYATTAHAHTHDFLERPLVAFTCSVALWTVVSAVLHPLPTEYVKIKYSLKSKYAGETLRDDSSVHESTRVAKISLVFPLCHESHPSCLCRRTLPSPDLMTLPLPYSICTAFARTSPHVRLQKQAF